jgi:hypothetical protein
MMVDINKFAIRLPCPHCGEAREHMLRNLVSNPHTICPNCDRLIDLTKWQPHLREMVKSIPEMFGNGQDSRFA